MTGFTHFDDDGNAIMVDVSDKLETERTATAKGTVKMSAETIKLIVTNQVKKGDVLTVAQLAGIMGAKRTPDLIPLFFPAISISIPKAFPNSATLCPICPFPIIPSFLLFSS